LVVSAKSERGLLAQADRLAEFLDNDDDGDLVGVAGGLVSARAVWEHRAVVVAADRAQAVSGLRDLVTEVPSPAVVTGVASGVGKTVLVFPGQGAQWVGMGRQLWVSEPVFAARMADCERALAPYVDWSLSEVISDGLPLDRVDVVQPVSWAVMVSLAALWRSVDLSFDAVVGHSQGEIAAACVAGVVSLGDGARIVSARSRVIGEQLSGRGGMLSVALGETEVRGDLVDGVEVAVVNSPSTVVLAGRPEALAELQARFEERGIRARMIPVDYASHTAQVDDVTEHLTTTLGEIHGEAPEIPWLSTVDGQWVTSPVDVEYWVRNLRQPVRFADAVETLTGQGFGVFVECGPHPVLTTAVQDVAGDDAVVVGTLRRDQGDRVRFLRSMAELFVRGVSIDWTTILPTHLRPAALPTTAFQHDHYWLLPRTVGDAGSLGQATMSHPILGAVVETPSNGGFVMTGVVSDTSQSWLAESVVSGVSAVPPSALVELAIQAGDHAGTPMLEQFIVEAPMLVPNAGTLRIQVVVGEPDESGHRTVGVYSRPDAGDPMWTCHATGNMTVDGPVPVADTETWPPANTQSIDVDDFYAALADRGYDYGPAFRGMTAAWTRDADLFAEVTLPESADAEGFAIHPVLLDTAVHLSLGTGDDVILPTEWAAVALHASGATTVRVRMTPATGGGVSVELTDPTGAPVLSLGSVLSRPVQLAPADTRSGDHVYRVDWSSLPDSAADVAGTVRMIAGAAGLDGPAADWIVLPVASDGEGTEPQRVRAAVNGVLDVLRSFLGNPDHERTRLVVATQHAVQPVDTESIDPVASAVWGLVRSAQSENPERIVLVDIEGEVSEDIVSVVAGAVVREEWQVAIREGGVWVPRLVRVVNSEPAVVLDPAGTVLITGGTGVLGALTARHVVAVWGVRSVVLASRRGMAAEGATELVGELRGLGARVDVVACDVSDRDQVRGLLARVPVDAPLTGVVHTAGVWWLRVGCSSGRPPTPNRSTWTVSTTTLLIVVMAMVRCFWGCGRRGLAGWRCSVRSLCPRGWMSMGSRRILCCWRPRHGW
jgi:acyl transferase domain-containing protein